LEYYLSNKFFQVAKKFPLIFFKLPQLYSRILNDYTLRVSSVNN